jgi:hypothetical protein
MEHYQESQPAYLSLEVRLQKAADAGSFLWDDTAFGEAELKIVSWPLVELSYPDSRLDLKLRAVRALDGGHYLVSRDFVAKRIKR